MASTLPLLQQILGKSATPAADVKEFAPTVKALAAGSPLAVAEGAVGALVTQWCNWAATFSGDLKPLEAALSATSFLAGSSFSVADVVVLCVIAASVKADLQKTHPSVARWLDQVLHEPVIKAAKGVPAVACKYNREPLNLFASKPAAAAVAPAAKEAKPAAASKEAAAPKTAAAPQKEAAAAPAAPAAEGGKKDKKADKKKDDSAAAPSSGAGAAPAAAESAAAALEPIAYCEFRVGRIVKVWNHEAAERLFCEEIDLGEPTGPRKIASGLREHYTLEQMSNRLVVVASNLKARALVGFDSNGMVLAATSKDGKVELLDPPAGAKIGERVRFEGAHSEEAASSSQMAKKKYLDLACEHLKVDGASKAASYKGIKMMTSAGPVVVANQKADFSDATIH